MGCSRGAPLPPTLQPLAHIFSEFSGAPKRNADGSYSGSGDVKYHLGTSYDRPTINGKMVHLSLVANPSHLEAVNTVVMGKTRAKQYYMGDKERKMVMPVLLHGDGSFSGQVGLGTQPRRRLQRRLVPMPHKSRPIPCSGCRES